MILHHYRRNHGAAYISVSVNKWLFSVDVAAVTTDEQRSAVASVVIAAWFSVAMAAIEPLPPPSRRGSVSKTVVKQTIKFHAANVSFLD